ncbi:hypothetical protein FRX31_033129, partial [Thalictrum thalictroides]
ANISLSSLNYILRPPLLSCLVPGYCSSEFRPAYWISYLSPARLLIFFEFGCNSYQQQSNCCDFDLESGD